MLWSHFTRRYLCNKWLTALYKEKSFRFDHKLLLFYCENFFVWTYFKRWTKLPIGTAPQRSRITATTPIWQRSDPIARRDGTGTDAALRDYLSSLTETAAVCLGGARRGRTKCCSWWRRRRYCFINSPSTSNLQRAARWLNTETTHIKPACSTSWLNRRKPRRSHANNPPHKKYIRAESKRRRGREARLYHKITDLWRETLKEDI